MSEYQYYEFRALDRPLTSADQKYLRSLSSRAEITSTSFTNEYHFGSFRGDPLKMMHRCFDLHVYLANWGTRTLMLRVPREALDGLDAKAYANDSCQLHPQGDHVVIELETSDDSGDYFDDADLDEPWADDLLPIRALLLGGDPRPLYLAWLAGAPIGEDDEPEPPVPVGLADLPDALESLARFLGVEQDLLDVAALSSPAFPKASENPQGNTELAAWVAALPPADKDAALLQLLDGDTVGIRTSLLSRYRRELAASGRTAAQTVVTGRTAGQLLQLAQVAAEERKRVEAEKRREAAARKAKAAAEERQKHLEALSDRYDRAWAEIDAEVKLGATHYADVAKRLIDLRDAAAMSDRSPDFVQRMIALTEKYAKRSALMDRLRKAGLIARHGGAA